MVLDQLFEEALLLTILDLKVNTGVLPSPGGLNEKTRVHR